MIINERKKPTHVRVCVSVCENSPAPSDGVYKHPSFLNQTSTRLGDVSDASGVCGAPIKSLIESQQWQQSKQTNKQWPVYALQIPVKKKKSPKNITFEGEHEIS